MSNGGSGVELLITLGINSEESRKNLNRYIENLKLENLEVTLDVKSSSSSNKVLSDMDEQLNKVVQGLDGLSKRLEKMSSAKPLKMKVNTKPIEDAEELLEDFLQQLKSDGYEYKVNFSYDKNGERRLKDVIASIKDEFGEVQTIKYKMDKSGEFNEIFESIKNTEFKDIEIALNKLNKTMDDVRNKALLTKNQIADFDNLKLTIETSNLDIDKASQLNALNSQIKETITSTTQFNKVSKDIDEAIMSINRSGLIGTDRLDKLQEAIAKINSSDITLDEKVIKLRRELDLLNKEMSETAFQNKMSKAMQDAEISVKNLSSSLTKTTQVYKREALKMKNETDALKKEIEDLAKIPIFRNQKDIDDFNAKLKQTQSNVKEYGAKISEANRSSLTFLQSVKIALIRSVFIQ